jgi:hypothetical protein
MQNVVLLPENLAEEYIRQVRTRGCDSILLNLIPSRDSRHQPRRTINLPPPPKNNSCVAVVFEFGPAAVDKRNGFLGSPLLI